MSTEAATIFIAGDAAYANPMAVTIHSAVRHTPGPLRIVVASEGFEPGHQALLESAAAPAETVHVQVPPAWLEGLPTEGLPGPMFARLFIDRLVPAGTERALYLDGDILVRRSLQPLLDLDLQGCTVAAAAIGGLPVTAANAHRADEWPGSMLQVAGLPPSALLFNSGVLVIDVARWRDRRVAERVMALAAEWTYGDQHYLNAVLWDDWLPFDATWNGKEPDGAVIHFAGPAKPWNPDYYRNRFLREYHAAARAVGWDLRLSPRQQAGLLRRRVEERLVPPALTSGARTLHRRLRPPAAGGPRWDARLGR